MNNKFAVRYLKNLFYPLDIPEGIEVKHEDKILVRTEKGEEALTAVLVNHCIMKRWQENKSMPEPFSVIRVLNDKDKENLEMLKMEEVQAFFKCKDLVAKHKLNMNLVHARYTFDKRKVTFYYTAPERVDFRELLKDLRSEEHTSELQSP